ncbi:ankyrin repeat-containing domain protein, partial [Trichophaea hybrida]
LIIAAQKGLVPATRLLLEQTQFINATDSSGRTALHHAAAIINEEVMSLLVERGADKHIQDDDGATAQHLVVKNL